MNTVKKAMSAFMMLLLVVVLAACGGQKPAESEAPASDAAGGEATEAASGEDAGGETAGIPTTGLSGEITVQAEEAWKPYYEAAIQRVTEANPDAKITIIEKAAIDNLDVIDQTGPDNADVPDVFAIPADRIYGMVESEDLAALNSEAIMTTVGGWENFDKFNEGLGGNFKIGEEYFGFPMNIESLITFKNKANAETSGVDLTKPLEVTGENYNKVLIPAFDAWYGVALLNAGGVELLQKNDDGTFTSDMTTAWADLAPEKQDIFKALFDYWKANFDNNTSLFDPDAGYGYTDAEIASGKNGISRLGGAWDYENIAKATGEENLEIGSLNDLTIAGKPLVHWKGGWAYAINVRDEADEGKMALAQALIAELANPKFAQDFFQATGKIMENVPAADYEAMGLNDAEKATVLATIESYENAVARPLFTEYGKVWDTWKNAVLSWNSVKPADAEAAYNELNSAFTQMMGELK